MIDRTFDIEMLTFAESNKGGETESGHQYHGKWIIISREHSLRKTLGDDRSSYQHDNRGRHSIYRGFNQLCINLKTVVLLTLQCVASVLPGRTTEAVQCRHKSFARIFFPCVIGRTIDRTCKRKGRPTGGSHGKARE